jgi:hypothetical protein
MSARVRPRKQFLAVTLLAPTIVLSLLTSHQDFQGAQNW